MMAFPPRPDPPVVGKVTHNSIELMWYCKDDESPRKGDSRLKYCVQEEEIGSHSKGFGTVYVGYANKHLFEGLEPRTQYRYRVRALNDNGYSAWSQTIMISTTKKPKTSEDLHKAVAKGDESSMMEILNGLSWEAVDAPDKFGLSPLMVASQRNLIHIVKALLGYGADIKYQTSSGKDSLMMACFSGHVDIAKILRENGASWDHRDRMGSTALHWAVDGGNINMIRWMIQDGAPVDVRDRMAGWTPLMRLLMLNTSALPGNLTTSMNIAKVLIHHNANINSQDKYGKTVLMIAAMNGLEPLVKLLVSKGAHVQTKNPHGKTALDMAKSLNREKVASFLEEYVQNLRAEEQKKKLQAVRDHYQVSEHEHEKSYHNDEHPLTNGDITRKSTVEKNLQMKQLEQREEKIIVS